MSVRGPDDDLRIDVPQLMRRLAVELPRLFDDDGTPTSVVAPLRAPAGASLPDVMVGGWDFDGELGHAGSLRIAGLRLPKLGYYIADDDPLRSAASTLHGRLPRWPTSLEETARQDEAATLPSASAPAMLRRVNCTIRDISIAKDVLRAGGTLGAVMIAVLQASDALMAAEAARDAANAAIFGQETPEARVRLVEDAHALSVAAARGCLALVELLGQHRIAVAPHDAIPHAPGNEKRRIDLTDSRLVVMAAARLIVRIASFTQAPRHTAPGLTHRTKRVSAALTRARALVDRVAGFINGHHAGAPDAWSSLLGKIREIPNAQPDGDQDTAIELLPSILDRGGHMLGVHAAARIEHIAAISRIDSTRIFMLLHSARVEEAVERFPWLAAKHAGFPDFPAGFADALTVLLELQRCLAILRELVLRTRGPLAQREGVQPTAIAPRLTIPAAHRAFATSRRVAAALASHHGFATYAREFALSHAVYKAHASGQPLDPAHPLPVLQQGGTGWTARQAYRDPETIATTRDAFATSAVVTTVDRERRDLPRFFGMTAVEFATASLQTILAAHRRGAGAVTRAGGAHTDEIDWSIFTLTELMLKAIDASFAEAAGFRKRARDATSGKGAARLGQAMIKAHKPARVAAPRKRLRADVPRDRAWRIMRAGYDTAIDAAPAADQCVPAYWYNPEHDRPFWTAFQHAAKEPAPTPASGPPATRRDALMLELATFAAWAPRLIAELLPTPQTARVVTWLAHGFIGIAADPDFAGLR